jgi:glycosyltransferase involved in cell wall biosynthesis
MSARPTISVVMPVRNAEAWLAQAIESVLVQTFADFELIVVDDGSTDASPEIISALSRRDSRIRAVRQPQPEGLVSALNMALGLARGELLARLDADDVALPERLAQQVRCFDEQPSLVLLGSWSERIDEGDRHIGYTRPETNPERLAEMLQKSNPFVHSSVMMRTALTQKIGGYRNAFLGAEDADLWLRLSEHGVVANLPQILVCYRVHGGNVSQRFGVRQCFSARLARAAAAARRSSGVDPAARLSGPPDWWAPEAAQAFYAEAAHICRLLDLADRSAIATHRMDEVRLPSARQIVELSHAEKLLARRSLVNLLMQRNRSATLSARKTASALAILLVGRALFRSVVRGNLPLNISRSLPTAYDNQN